MSSSSIEKDGDLFQLRWKDLL